MTTSQPTIIYTLTDEAPFLATQSLLPIVTGGYADRFGYTKRIEDAGIEKLRIRSLAWRNRHGRLMPGAQATLQQVIEHRLAREAAILKALDGHAGRRIPDLVAELRARLYPPLAQIANEWQTRLGAPADYAKLIQFIIENDYINGECIRIDGATLLERTVALLDGLVPVPPAWASISRRTRTMSPRLNCPVCFCSTPCKLRVTP